MIDKVTVVTEAGIAATAEAIDAGAANEIIAAEMTAGHDLAEVTMIGTDGAARATVTAEDEGIEAATTTAVEAALVRALHAVTGRAARGSGLPTAAVRNAKQVVVRRHPHQKQQKMIAISELFSSSRYHSAPRPATFARFSRSSDQSSKLKLSKIESLDVQRGKLNRMRWIV